MKNLILFTLCAIFLTSCAKFPDGSSVWQDWLWVIPTVTGLGSAILLYIAYMKSKSGSKQQLPQGGYSQSKENVPIYKMGQFWFGLVLAIATFVIILMVNRDK